MTVRENVHQLVDTLPEERLEDILDYINLIEDDDTLNPEEQAAVERGLEDIRQGRTISLEEFKRINDL
jgi:hypothetical protein